MMENELKNCTNILVIENDSDSRWMHYRLNQGINLELSCGPSLSYMELKFYTNYPDDDEEFCRYEFREIDWKFDKCEKTFRFTECDSNKKILLKVNKPGAYTYFITDKDEMIDNDEIVEMLKWGKKKLSYLRSVGYFIIDPNIREIDGNKITIDEMSIQTVISRCLGPLHEWNERLEFSHKLGYNSIHFTPFQKYGESGSCYSIKDHFEFDESISNGKIKDGLGNIINKLKASFNCLIVDLVLNHTSIDCPLIKQHPQCFYNLQNSPHLRPAFIVDRMLYHMTVLALKKSSNGFGKISTSSDLKRIETFIRFELFPTIRLIEFFVLDVDKTVKMFRDYLNSSFNHNDIDDNVVIIQDPLYRRLGCSIDFHKAYAKFVRPLNDSIDKVNIACNRLRDHLKWLNQMKYNVIQEIIGDIISNVLAQINYNFISDNGPKRKSFSLKEPLITNYFTICLPINNSSIESDEELMNSPDSIYIIANQGWVFGGSICDFAANTSQVYLRRELISWGDCAKIRWGSCQDDVPFIWTYMEKYIDSLIHHVDGFRLDNCHSTPLHVLEWVVDKCRLKKPNIILIGELFTNSESDDNFFVNRLALTCLIRERMSASSLEKLCHIVHRFGGKAVGSFLTDTSEKSMAKSITARAILTDMTHDNECLYKLYSPVEYIPTAAFVTMANCPIGSVRGFDEMVPYQINVVNETRHYTVLNDVNKYNTPQEIKNNIEKAFIKGKTNMDQGILELRKLLNDLHYMLKKEEFEEIYIDQINENIVTITRCCPKNNMKYVLISHHTFKNINDNNITQLNDHDTNLPLPLSTDWKHPEIVIPGIVEEIIIEAYPIKINSNYDNFKSKYITGTSNYLISLKRNLNFSQSKMALLRFENLNDPSKVTSFVALPNFPIGSILLLKVVLHSQAIENLNKINETINLWRNYSILNTCDNDISEQIDKFTYSDINFILFKCHTEEQDENISNYQIPNYGSFIYNGLYGIQILLNSIRKNNDLGHALCTHLRNGYWLLDHIIKRLNLKYPHNIVVSSLQTIFDLLKSLPVFLLPTYFELTLRTFIELLLCRILIKLNSVMLNKDLFSKILLISSFVLIGNIQNIHPPMIDCDILQNLPNYIDPNVTISAGLPHFSTSWYRCWGRDIFISLRGLLLLTGRVHEAKLTLLSIAATIRHGLIPNLISDYGHHPRYNARDATWFYLQALKEYCIFTKDLQILNETVLRIFDNDDSFSPSNSPKKFKLFQIVQEILQKHYDGIEFIEHGHGPKLDQCMNEQGFQVKCGIDHNNGFIFGGNRYNCGTWMDKMGSSHYANNFAFPATPRDGSAIELVALFYSFLQFLEQIPTNHYPFKGVKDDQLNSVITWKEFKILIKDNFENNFWIPTDLQDAKNKFTDRANHIFRLGIYKDSHGSSLGYTDYQLRPNFLIAMSVAPDLFQAKHAVIALNIAHQELESLYGIRTLDPSDWSFNGFYNNSDSSNNFNTANGFNYHQGPEWIWISGHYIKSLLYFMPYDHKNKFITIVQSMLSRLYHLAFKNEWLGLPELTNFNGTFCSDSCQIQTWSVACILDALHTYYLHLKN